MIISNVVTMAAGEVREMACGGNYFEMRAAVGLVALIELMDRSGGVVSLLTDAESTDYVRTSRNFEQVRITNGATAQAIKFYYGDGDSGSNRFTGVVSGTVSMDSATILALTAAKYAIRPEMPGAAFASAAAMSANVPQVVFNAALNVNGSIIYTANANNWGGVITIALLHKSGVVPASTVDGSVLMMASVVGADAGTAAVKGSLETAQFIPAGHGLYFISETGIPGGATNTRSCRYTLL